MCVFSFVTVNLKNLQRFLRRDDAESRDIFMQLGKWNTIRQDILPIIISYRDQFDLVLNAGEYSNSYSVGSS